MPSAPSPSPRSGSLLEFGLSSWFFGRDHALATFQQRVLWRSAWAVFVYTALVSGFGGALYARRANRAALLAAQAESGLVRAELAAISGKLNPHFLFNTLNSIIFLTSKDAAAAERALLGFARMLRYLLDANRGAADRVPLREELDFVRDYLGLESLRLGARLAVDWQIDEAAIEETVPPLTLQPLVENAIVHGIAPRTETGTVTIECRRLAPPDRLLLRVRDDGAGCSWPRHGAEGRRRRPRRAVPPLRPRLRRQGALRGALRAGRGLLRRDRPAGERRRRVTTTIMTTIKRTPTLIAEDEPLASEGLAEWVREMPELELIGIRADGPGTLQAMRELAPELVLMDIHMPGMNGLQVLRALAGDPERSPPAVIFTTAYDEHAVAAFELHAVDYLLKPFSQERFEEAVRTRCRAPGRARPALPALHRRLAGGPSRSPGCWCATAARSFRCWSTRSSTCAPTPSTPRSSAAAGATWCACRSRRSSSGSTRPASSRSIAPASSTSTSSWRWFPARTRSSRCSCRTARGSSPAARSPDNSERIRYEEDRFPACPGARRRAADGRGAAAAFAGFRRRRRRRPRRQHPPARQCA